MLITGGKRMEKSWLKKNQQVSEKFAILQISYWYKCPILEYVFISL